VAWFPIILLAVVQGITEFLPISSSGHLQLVPAVAGWPDQGLTIDVAVHVGSLGAVMLYLWRDLWSMLRGLGQAFLGRVTSGAKLLGLLILATLPVVAAGFALDRYIPGGLRSIEVIAWATVGFGLLLYYVDQRMMAVNRLEHMNVVSALIIGMSQIVALIPGTSRSGITMTAARALGFERVDAARFSMLLSIPTIIGAGGLKGWELWQSGNVALGRDAAMSAGFAFVSALIAIALMMAWLRRASFTPFVVYRVLLGLVLLAWVYGLLTEFGMAPPKL